MDAKTTLAASVQAKKGRLYAVIQGKENGKTKPVWRALGLPEGTNKSKVNKAYREVVKDFENDYAEQLARNEKPASDIPIFDYMCAYYKRVEKNIQKSTAESYHGMIYGRIRRYFTARNNLTVGNITSKDIEDFYEWMFESGVVANTVIHYHTVLHSAFKRAFKDGLIDANPFDRIDRPKKNKFTGEHYSEDEMITMFRLFRGDVIYPAVVLAGGLGLRRSEALGARWSRVDWDKRTILLDTKVIEYKEDGKVVCDLYYLQDEGTPEERKILFYSTSDRYEVIYNCYGDDVTDYFDISQTVVEYSKDENIMLLEGHAELKELPGTVVYTQIKYRAEYSIVHNGKITSMVKNDHINNQTTIDQSYPIEKIEGVDHTATAKFTVYDYYVLYEKSAEVE